MAKDIRIIAQPDHFIDGVICPFCKQPTLGAIPIPVHETLTRYSLTCLYADCILNFMTPVSWELDVLVQELFKGTDYERPVLEE
jgi:hypothetical protein